MTERASHDLSRTIRHELNGALSRFRPLIANAGRGESLSDLRIDPLEASAAIARTFKLHVECSADSTIDALHARLLNAAEINSWQHVIPREDRRRLKSREELPQARTSYQVQMLNGIISGTQIGPYRIKEYAGSGAFKVVYRAIDAQNRAVALHFGKRHSGDYGPIRIPETTAECPSELDDSPGEVIEVNGKEFHLKSIGEYEVDEKMWGEAAILGSFTHPNLLKLHSVIQVNGRPVLVTDYIEGKTLREKLRASECLRLTWFLGAARCLIELQQQGMGRHGDLKPENFIVGSNGHITLIDPDSEIGSRGLVETSPYYNPLVLRNSKADVMAMGIMLYEILTGKLPFYSVPLHAAAGFIGDDVQTFELERALSFPLVSDFNSNAKVLGGIVTNCIHVPQYGLREFEAELGRFLAEG